MPAAGIAVMLVATLQAAVPLAGLHALPSGREQRQRPERHRSRR